MGTTTSKESLKDDATTNGLLSRSLSSPAKAANRIVGESLKKTAWKSRLFSMPSSRDGGNDASTIFRMSSKLKPVQEEEIDKDQFDEEQLYMHQLSESPQNRLDPKKKPRETLIDRRGHRQLNRSVSFQPLHEVVEIGCRSPVAQKSQHDDAYTAEMPGLGYTPTGRRSLSRSVSQVQSPSTSSKDLDKSSGLSLLLGPVLTPSRSIASPARGTNFRSLSSQGSLSFKFKEDLDPGFPVEPGPSGSPFVSNKNSELDWSSISTFTQAESSVFDPVILASVEKAVEVSCDSWQSSELSSSGNVSTCSETSSDADSPKEPNEDISNVEGFKIVKTLPNKEGNLAGPNSCYRKSFSFTRLFSGHSVKDWSRQDYLEQFEKRCPPGCEDKVVLYFTSLRGIRKTFEDCCTLRLILKGFRVHVDERDVWMHLKFRQELSNIFGMPLSVPRLFVLGRYIGGAEEVKELHEEGILARLVDGLPVEWRQVCELCGDMRFIPCTTCSGSRKTFNQDDTLERCPECNENGLIMCTSCYS